LTADTRLKSNKMMETGKILKPLSDVASVLLVLLGNSDT
jgi:hypothetical protein